MHVAEGQEEVAEVVVSSRGVGGSGHGYNSLLTPAGGSAYSKKNDFHHPRFRFLMAPRAPRASFVSWTSTPGACGAESDG